MTNREFKEAFEILRPLGAAESRFSAMLSSRLATLRYFSRTEAERGTAERPRPRGTAWALGRIGGEEALNNLEKSMKSEGDSQVRDIAQALNKLNTPSEKEAPAGARLMLLPLALRGFL